MKANFAKAIAANITIIAGNVARVALIDEKVIPEAFNDRPDCCRRIEKAQANIAALLQEPGAHPDAKD